MATGIAGLLGIRRAESAQSRIAKAVGEIKPGKWPVDPVEFCRKAWESYGIERPNKNQSHATFVRQMLFELEDAGSVIVWRVPGTFGGIREMWLIPSFICRPSVGYCEDHPFGYYNVVYCEDRETTYYTKIGAEHVDVIRKPLDVEDAERQLDRLKDGAYIRSRHDDRNRDDQASFKKLLTAMKNTNWGKPPVDSCFCI